MSESISAADTERAVVAASRAETAAGVQMREISSLADMDAVVQLYSILWGREKNPPVTVELLRAFAKAGNYIGGAFDGDELLGACVGFFSAPSEEALHSHIAGVSTAARGRSVGFALKVHQRAWAMTRGVPEIAWTFDPLVARNAYFNIEKLGADPVEYLPDFYGDMTDLINGGDPSDRLLVRWRLASARAVAACEGTAVPSDAHAASNAGAELVAIPSDIERMRSTDPAEAHVWRESVRSRLTALMASGSQIVGFDRSGQYILQKASTS